VLFIKKDLQDVAYFVRGIGRLKILRNEKLNMYIYVKRERYTVTKVLKTVKLNGALLTLFILQN
jgi:hypothetical protein